LNYSAKAYNYTGINWDNVELVLSTANPFDKSSMPELKPWIIGSGGDQTKFKSERRSYYSSSVVYNEKDVVSGPLDQGYLANEGNSAPQKQK
jgi:hypothetical protein